MTRAVRRILLTNDDGIDAPGLLALVEPLGRFGEVTVVAPVEEQSGVSHSIVYRRAVHARRRTLAGTVAAWAVDAYPVDCVKLTFDRLMPARPDLVVSGINRGANLGGHLFYSGTVAAALEASVMGVMGIAVSLGTPPSDPFWNPDPVERDRQSFDFDRAALTFAEVLRTLDGLELGSTAINVNIPPDGTVVRGMRWAAQCGGPMPDTYEVTTEPDGREGFRMRSRADEYAPDVDSDRALLAQGFVTITPLRSDLNCTETLRKLRDNPLSLPGRGQG